MRAARRRYFESSRSRGRRAHRHHLAPQREVEQLAAIAPPHRLTAALSRNLAALIERRKRSEPHIEDAAFGDLIGDPLPVRREVRTVDRLGGVEQEFQG